MANCMHRFWYTKINRQKKNGGKDGKTFYKLMSNAVYDKVMKNLKNRVDVRLVNNEKYYLKWISKPTYVAQNIFDNDLLASHKVKTIITLNKPAYLGMCILELSEVPMYEFLYDYIKNKYGNKSKLLLPDADS